jgi:septal ring-binding cell division protein DamX
MNTNKVAQISIAPPLKKDGCGDLYSNKKYSLQMFGSYHLDDVQNLQKRLASKDETNIWHTEHNGKDWYVLTYGQYTSMAQATLAKDQLPDEVKQAGPWVRNVTDLELVQIANGESPARFVAVSPSAREKDSQIHKNVTVFT